MKKNTFIKRNYFSIYSDMKNVNGRIKNYEVINFGPRVGALITHKDKVLLVEQYRYLIDKPSLEIPGGSVNKNEGTLEAIQREIFEETGSFISSLKHLIDYYPGLDNVDNKTSIYFSKLNDKDTPPSIYSNQEIDSLRWISFTECLRLIKSGEILDAMTSLSILAYYNYELKL